MKQAIRIFIAFVLLAVAVSVVNAGIQWINNPEHRGGPASDAMHMFAIAALAAVISAILFRSFLKNRRPSESTLGLFERLAERCPGLSAGVTWGLIGLCLLWGIGMVWVQDRLMKRPRDWTVPRAKVL